MTNGVVFVGVGIFPHRVAGDKNFLLELAGELRSRGVPTKFVSIVNGPRDMPEAEHFTFLNRFLHKAGERFVRRDRDGTIIGYRHPHGLGRTWTELTATLVNGRTTLRKVLGSFDRAVVHWIDSSLLIPTVRAVCGDRHRYVASTFRYVPQGRLGVALRRAALDRADFVFTGTEASRRFLVGEGCSATRVQVGPWGCRARDDWRRGRASSGELRLLWSGYLQQIGREDLLRTVDVARRVRARRSDIRFTFSLKPECFEGGFADLNAPGIEVVAGGSGFLKRLAEFDAFLSPVGDVRSTPAPPLTWLEAFAAGVPVITTAHPGVDEVVVHKESGLVAAGYDSLGETLMSPTLGEDLERMRVGAYEQHARRFDIRAVARRYSDLYHRLFLETR